MSTLKDILKDAHRARLIPSIADSRKEQRTVSILLATLSVVRRLLHSYWNVVSSG